MKHTDPRAFGQSSAGEYLRAIAAQRRRDARTAALTGAGFALAFSAATGVAMALGSEGGAALFAVAATLALVVAIFAASEAR